MTATNKFKPRKRIKALHRAAKREGVVNGLRSFAKALASSPIPGFEIAQAWLTGKGIAFEVLS